MSAKGEKNNDFDKNDPNAWINRGIELAKQGKHEEAHQAYDHAIKLDPSFAAAWGNKGKYLTELDRHEEAIQAYNQAINLDPKYADAWYNKGFSLAELDKHEEAIQAYDQAIELDPKLVSAWYNKGISLDHLGRHEEAIEAYVQAIELDPKDAASWNNMGVVLFELDRYEEAIKAYEQAIKLDPKNAVAWYNKGNSLVKLDSHEEAIQAYDKAIELDPKKTYAWGMKGNCLGNLGRLEEAIQAYDKVIELDSKDAKAWVNKGISLAELSRHREAIQAYDKVIELDPKSTKAWYNKGNCLGELEKHKKAIKVYDHAIKLDPKDVAALNNKGVSLMELGKHVEALEEFNQAIEIKPKYTLAWGNKVETLENLGRFKDAVETCKMAVRRCYKKESLRFTLASIYYHFGDIRKSNYHIKKILEADGDQPAAINLRGKIKLLQKRYPEARKDFQKASILNIENPAYRLWLVYNNYLDCEFNPKLKEKKYTQGIFAIIHELEVLCVTVEKMGGKEDIRAYILYLLGSLYLKVHDLSMAVNKLQECCQIKAKKIHESPIKKYSNDLMVEIWEHYIQPSLWKWWWNSPYNKCRKRFALGFLGSSIVALLALHPFIPDILKKLSPSAEINWTLYTLAIAILLAIIIVPGIKTFKASGIEVEMVKAKQFEPVLSPSVIEEHIKEVEKLQSEYARYKTK